MNPDSTVEEMEEKEEIRIPWGSGIVGYTAESGAMVNIPDAYQVGGRCWGGDGEGWLRRG